MKIYSRLLALLIAIALLSKTYNGFCQDSAISLNKESILFDCFQLIKNSYQIHWDSSVVIARLDLNSAKARIKFDALKFEEQLKDTLTLKKLRIRFQAFPNKVFIALEPFDQSKHYSREFIMYRSSFLNSFPYRNLFSDNRCYIEIMKPIGGWEQLDAYRLLKTYVLKYDTDYKVLLDKYTKLFIPVFFWYKTKSRESRKLIIVEYSLSYKAVYPNEIKREKCTELE